MALTTLDGPGIRQWVADAVTTLRRHRAAIDSVNVFPVPDADTGTNLLHTLTAGAQQMHQAQPVGHAPTLRALATGALHGARGNSGVILSQVLRGFADAAAQEPTEFAAPHVVDAVRRALALAKDTITDPAPGTMLSYLEALSEVPDAADLVSCTRELTTRGEFAVRQTRAQSRTLRRADVVDAGAYGLHAVFAELHNTVAERSEIELPSVAAPSRAISDSFTGLGQVAASAQTPCVGAVPGVDTADVVLAAGESPSRSDGLFILREAGSAEFQYEVMYRLDGDFDASVLRNALVELGDCVSIAGDGAGAWAVHVHCNDIGAAIEAGLDQGRPHAITVARFADQVASSGRFAADRAVVTLARGQGIARLFRAEGANVLVLDEYSPPNAFDVLSVIAGCRAATVTVLSNEPELTELIEHGAAAAREAGQSVTVIPTMSPVQGLAALAVHDETRRAEDDVVAMAEAAAAMRRGAVVVATEQALTWAGRCEPGDVLAMLDGEVVSITSDIHSAASNLLAKMLDYGGELVTVLLGAYAPDDLAQVLERRVRAERPEVEIAVYAGDQHDAIVVVGVE